MIEISFCFGVVMKKMIVRGGVPLFGSVTVSGSKNAALPILFAALSTDGVSVIDDLPDIGDVKVAINILEQFGVAVERRGGRLLLDTRRLTYRIPPAALVKRIRASTYLLGASLARFGRFPLMDFGGCNFSDRPIDLHISSAIALGASYSDGILCTRGLRGTEIELKKPSVGATVNTLIMAASAEGVTRIKGFAKEPHVSLLISFLRSAGADVLIEEDVLTVKGTHLHGGRVTVIGDMIEAGTYLTAGLITGGEVQVVGVAPESLLPYLSLLEGMGAVTSVKENGISVRADGRLDYARITASPYPGFPTDLQPIVAPLFAMNSGGIIEDTVFPDRFGYLDVLSAFGLDFERIVGGTVIKPSNLHPASVSSPCLRGGAACMLLSLAALGTSEINCAELILRGYERPTEKLSNLGANIEIV